MSQLEIDWSEAPVWAHWAAQDADGAVWAYDCRPAVDVVRAQWVVASDAASIRHHRIHERTVIPASNWRESLVQRPVVVTYTLQTPDHGAALRAQIGHLLEDMTSEQLDALYAYVRKQLDAAKFDELNRQLDKPFGEVPREWQLKAFEAYLDGHAVYHWHITRGDWTDAPVPSWVRDMRYRIEPKQS